MNRTETSVPAKSIPRVAGSIKNAMLSLLDGLPVVSREFGATLCEDATAEEFTVALTRLCGAERQVIVRSKFQKGDLWDQFQDRAFRAERARWLACLRLRIPEDEKREKYLQEFRHCGWVARAWPERFRDDKHGWTWYVKREVSSSGEVVMRSSAGGPAIMRGVERVMRDDGEYIELLSPTEKPARWRVCELPVRDERTPASDPLTCLICKDAVGADGLHKCWVTGEVVAVASSPELFVSE